MEKGDSPTWLPAHPRTLCGHRDYPPLLCAPKAVVGSTAAGTAPLQSMKGHPGAEGNFVRDSEKSDTAPGETPDAQHERAAGCVLLADPLCRRAPWPNIPQCSPGRGNSALLSAQHQCQASQTLLCSPNPSQQTQRSVPRILLESGVCPATPGCSECQEQDPEPGPACQAGAGLPPPHLCLPKTCRFCVCG